VALLLKKEQVQKAALWIIFCCCLLAMPAFFSGEGAEELIEELPGVSHELIHEHEEKAEVFIWLCAATGLLALFSALPVAKNLALKKRLPAAVAVAGLITFLRAHRLATPGDSSAIPKYRNKPALRQHQKKKKTGIRFHTGYGHLLEDILFGFAVNIHFQLALKGMPDIFARLIRDLNCENYKLLPVFYSFFSCF
jgi:hypothetical protein